MKPSSPHHAILHSLLERKQYEACRTTVEDMIAEQMAAPEPNDHELAYLHLFLCRAFQGEQQHELAGAKADIAAFLARKLKDGELLIESLHRAGFNYIQAGLYRNAIDRFTACLELGSDLSKAKALFNRGHAYERQKAFSFAIQDFAGAIRLAADHDPELVQICRINLAWDLIMLKEFAGADEVLEQLSGSTGSGIDRYTALQVAHDRLHISFLKGQGGAALSDAIASLREAGNQHPEVRARIAQTLMALAVERGFSEQGFTLGVLTKRLAGQAGRPDIDEEAGGQMQVLAFQTGTESLAQSLLRMGQVTQGALSQRPLRRGQQARGVG